LVAIGRQAARCGGLGRGFLPTLEQLLPLPSNGRGPGWGL